MGTDARAQVEQLDGPDGLGGFGGFDELAIKVRSGEPLSHEDGLALYGSADLAGLGGLAHEVRTRRNGDTVSFAVERVLEITERTDALEAVRRATAWAGEGATTLRLRAGAELAPESAVRVVGALRSALPDPVAVRGFTVADVVRFAALSGAGEGGVLEELAAAGLSALSWDEPRQSTGDAGDAGDTAGTVGTAGTAGGPGLSWADEERTLRLAHARGLPTPATLYFGYGEAAGDRVGRALALRALQQETGGFDVLVPLSPGAPHGVTGAEILTTFAVSRLLCDNVPHLSASWVPHGEQTAQLVLQHGADELSGPVAENAAQAGALGEPGVLVREELLTLIRDSGFRPVERDARRGVLRSYEGLDPERREAPQPMRL
ncbi:hypothetical protein [Streptomyces iconiensis]|uniref:CofH/MqnC-like C-terminal domain-containing protein n=1 Tax=Streptomyces iconiensis TaxID=1384038 RepID=A0ABT6ZY87_9ACTN|nr:hypothetical protein [Streptomyces iconiensis]MDJ1133812.1 hypothetical protein [Streptomyces iconiensis]